MEPGLDEQQPEVSREAHLQAEQRAAEARGDHRARVRILLRRLDGRGTECSVEVLRRAKPFRVLWARAIFRRVVQNGASRALVQEVLPAYALDGVGSPHRAPRGTPFHSASRSTVLVTPQARVWFVAAHGNDYVGERTYQVMTRSAKLVDLGEDELARLAQGLQTCFERIAHVPGIPQPERRR